MPTAKASEAPPPMGCFIGLMSGTSLDGVDAVLARRGADGQLHSAGHAHVAFDPGLRAELLRLNRSGPDELHRAALATTGLMIAYAQALSAVLAGSALKASDIRAVGAHGQTVRHRPGEFDGRGYTLQLMNGALLAELCGIDVVCDFRSRDVAAGGQGAPLVPAFHAARFAQAGRSTAVLNIGGIANLTLLGAEGAVQGFDSGPGNMLMDLWCQRHHGAAYDAGGRWAATGSVHPGLLAALLDEPFFGRRPPKSTGRDLFDVDWLDARLAGHALPAQDTMATLTELTARSATDALRRHAPGTETLLVCGGGAFNVHLMDRLAELCGPGVAVKSTAEAGVAPDQVEALAFAWLASAHLQRKAGNVPAVTGAEGTRVLGALYPAG